MTDAAVESSWSADNNLSMRFTRAWIEDTAAGYPSETDDEVLNVVHPRVKARGYYDLADLLTVGRWKSVRATGWLRSNDAAEVEWISRNAFAAPVRLQHRVLTLLTGVGQPMSSALLTVWRPDLHTVYDVRAMTTLCEHGYVKGSWLDYAGYRELCVEVAKNIGVDLRTLDRALYMAGGVTGR